MFKTSLSAYQAFQRCEQLYYNRYVRKLNPIVRGVAPQRGITFHEYLGVYYEALRDGSTADRAHADGLTKIDTYRTEFDLAASLAFQTGNEEAALAYKAMPDEILDLARRYHNIHGRADADRYEPLIVEEYINIELVGGIASGSVLDLVTRDKHTGYVALWEHKSTSNVPEMRIRLQDLQTLLYATILERQRGIHVDGTIWNYARTTVPKIPDLLKPKRKGQLHGGLTKRVDLDTNWETYEAAILRNGLDVSEYQDVRNRLIEREAEVYFPRYEHQILADPNILLRDYARSSTRMRRLVWEWEQGRSEPVRSLGYNCNFCDFRKLCEAVVMGGDEEDILKKHYRTSKNGAKEKPDDGSSA